MKVYIGPHIKWFGPYQLADLLQKVGVSEERCDAIGRRLSRTWVNDLLTWIHARKKRRISIKLAPYDIWNANTSLALVILPVLKALRERKHSFGYIKDEDAPEHLRSTAAPNPEPDAIWDRNAEARYDWVLDEMVWAFEQLTQDWESQYYGTTGEDGSRGAPDYDGRQRHQARIDNGLRLFGTYFETLWD